MNPHERLMTVTLNISGYDGQKADKKASEEVERAFQLKPKKSKAGEYRANLFIGADDELRSIHRAINALRSFHYANTFRWKYNQQVLDCQNFENYYEFTSRMKALIEQRVSDFVNVYQQRVNEALSNRGGLAAPEDYPTPGEVADRFAVSIEFGPLDTSDLRLQIPPQRLETLKGDIEKRVTAKLGEVSKEVIERFCSLLKVATTQLQKRPDSGRYHASWQQNLKDFLVAAKGLVELQASDELDDLYAEAQRLVDDYDEAELKEDLSTRADAADKAQSIYDKMLAVFGEKS